jgi:hypothetical protein
VRIPTALLNPLPSSNLASSTEDVPSALLVEKKDGKKSKGKEKEILEKGKATMGNVSSEAKEGAGAKVSKSPLIEEIGQEETTPAAEKPKGILKQSPSASTSAPAASAAALKDQEQQEQKSDLMMPTDVSWSWETLDSGRLQVTIYVPDLVRPHFFLPLTSIF